MQASQSTDFIDNGYLHSTPVPPKKHAENADDHRPNLAEVLVIILPLHPDSRR